MPTLKMPDGTDVSFPDDMPKSQIQQLVTKKFPDAMAQMKASRSVSQRLEDFFSPDSEQESNFKRQAQERQAAQPPAPTPPPASASIAGDNPLGSFDSNTGDLMRSFASGATGTLSDRLNAMMAGGTLTPSQDQVNQQLQQTKDAMARQGAAGQVANAAGAMGTASALPFGTAAKAIASGAGVAGATDAIQQLNSGQDYNVANTAKSFLEGGASGLLGNVVGKELAARILEMQGIVNPSNSAKTIWQSAEGLTSDAIAKMKAGANMLDSSGVRVNKQSLQALANSIEKQIKADPDMNFSYTSDPQNSQYAKQALTMLRNNGGANSNPSLSMVNNMRQDIRDLAYSDNGDLRASPQDHSLLKYIYKQFGNYFDNMRPTPAQPQGAVGVVLPGGNVAQGFKGLDQMNEFYPKQQKASIVSGMFKRAWQDSMDGKSYDEALRDQITKYVRPNMKGNLPKASDSFDPNEIKAMEDYSEGGAPTRMLNLLDRSFGYGLLGDLHRMYSLPIRTYLGSQAKGETPEMFKTLTGLDAMPTPSLSTGVPASGGAAASATIPPALAQAQKNAQQQGQQ